MIETAMENASELLREIWEVDDESDRPAPEFARRLGRATTRLSNLGIVLIYAVLVAYAVLLTYAQIPQTWREAYGSVAQQFWFWVAAAIAVLTALRFGLDATKTLKRWRVSSLIGSVLIFNLLLEKAPPLFGFAGISPVDRLFGAINTSEVGQLLQKAMGM